MKQKSYDVQDLYKDYMQSVSADPTAIDDILSGERQPANTGAKIKHSTGRMATVTAAAAVIAVCAGIGLSNMNANDDSSIKPAANQTTTTTAVTTSQQQKQQKTEDAEFKSEVTQMFASDHGLRVVVKNTALNVAAKSLIAEADKQLKENLHCALSITTADQDTSRFAGASISAPKIDGDSFTSELIYEPNGSTNIFTDGTKCTVRVTIPGEEYKLLKNTGVAEFTIKKNMTERVFKSASGKTMWLSDYHFNVGMNGNGLDKTTFNNFEITFADGTVKTKQDIECVGGYSTKGTKNDPNTMIAFLNKLDSSKVTSIKYAGETFTPQQENIANEDFKAELVELNASDHGMIAAVKFTALNDKAKAVLKTKIATDAHSQSKELESRLSCPRCVPVSDDAIIVYIEDIGGDSIINNGDVINAVCRLPASEKDAAKGVENESFDSAMASQGRHISITINKNQTERVFKSKDGKTIWLSDYHYRAENVSEELLKSETWKTNSIKFSDGSIKTGTTLGMLGGATTTPDANKNSVATFYFGNKIDSRNAVSITYEGVEYTAQ